MVEHVFISAMNQVLMELLSNKVIRNDLMWDKGSRVKAYVGTSMGQTLDIALNVLQ